MIFQRVLTYTLNSITKKIVQVLFIAAGLLMTGHAVLTPLADGVDHDRRRCSRHVAGDRQRAPVRASQFAGASAG